MSTKHTPSPFWFAKAEDSARFDYAVGAGNGEIAHVDRRADAVLFRAAPEMLAVLKSLDALWTKALPYTPEDKRNPDATDKRWLELRAAIAAAEGRS